MSDPNASDLHPLSQPMDKHKYHDLAVEIAQSAAMLHRPSYYSEPFQPHYWVICAIISGIIRGGSVPLSHEFDHPACTGFDGDAPLGTSDAELVCNIARRAGISAVGIGSRGIVALVNCYRQGVLDGVRTNSRGASQPLEGETEGETAIIESIIRRHGFPNLGARLRTLLLEATRASHAVGKATSAGPGPYLDEEDSPSNPLWKRLRSIANLVAELSPNAHMEAANVLLTASNKIRFHDIEEDIKADEAADMGDLIDDTVDADIPQLTYRQPVYDNAALDEAIAVTTRLLAGLHEDSAPVAAINTHLTKLLDHRFQLITNPVWFGIDPGSKEGDRTVYSMANHPDLLAEQDERNRRMTRILDSVVRRAVTVESLDESLPGGFRVTLKTDDIDALQPTNEDELRALRGSMDALDAAKLVMRHPKGVKDRLEQELTACRPGHIHHGQAMTSPNPPGTYMNGAEAAAGSAKRQDGEAWIVVKEHVIEHGKGGYDPRNELAYLWPADGEVYSSGEAAIAFIKAQGLELGWVAKQVKKGDGSA